MIHFAIHIDDMGWKKYYDGAFEWGFNSHGAKRLFAIKADKSENGELISGL
jgi:hypothetical protein